MLIVLSANKKCYLLMLLALLIGLGFELYFLGFWHFGGEVWAEAGSNYFKYSKADNFEDIFFSVDAGYKSVFLRIVSYVPILLHVPSVFIAHYYNFMALFLRFAFVLPFCLPVFRKVLRDDILRFLVCIFVFLVADFESRTYINATYFACFTLIYLSALAFASRNEKFYGFLWWQPLLLTVKPFALIVTPLVGLTLIFTKIRKYRILSGVSLWVIFWQIRHLVESKKQKYILSADDSLSFFAKAKAAASYFFGLLSSYSLGPWLTASPVESLSIYAVKISLGIAFILLGFFLFRKKTSQELALPLAALLALLGNSAINNFAQSKWWNNDLNRLAGIGIDRHSLPFYFCCVLILAWLVNQLIESYPKWKRPFQVLFAGWFFASGWFVLSLKLFVIPFTTPIVNVSKWQAMASQIDQLDTYCVPINPYGWGVYQNCRVLNLDVRDIPVRFELFTLDAKRFYNIENIPSTNEVIYLTLLIGPLESANTEVSIEVTAETDHGEKIKLSGTERFGQEGGLLMLKSTTGENLKNLKRVSIQSISPKNLQIGFMDKTDQPSILVMGR